MPAMVKPNAASACSSPACPMMHLGHTMSDTNSMRIGLATPAAPFLRPAFQLSTTTFTSIPRLSTELAVSPLSVKKRSR